MRCNNLNATQPQLQLQPDLSIIHLSIQFNWKSDKGSKTKLYNMEWQPHPRMDQVISK